jgi:hypothetical protein
MSLIRNALYRYLPRPQLGQGAREDAFLAFQTRPVMPYQGPGIPVRWTYWLTEPPQVYVMPALTTQNITGPGVASGTIWLTPLANNPSQQ